MSIFLILFKASLNDKLSLLWSLALPVIMLLIGKMFIQTGDSSYSFLIALLALSAVSYGLMGTAFEYFSYRSTGVFKLVAISKTGIALFLFYFTLARLSVTLIGLLLLLVLGVAVLQIDISTTNPFNLIAYFLFLALISNLLGVICGNFGKDAGFIATITNILLVVLIASSGLFYSLEMLPKWLKNLFQFSPLEIISGLAKTNGIQLFELSYVITLSIILALVAVKFFKSE